MAAVQLVVLRNTLVACKQINMINMWFSCYIVSFKALHQLLTEMFHASSIFYPSARKVFICDLVIRYAEVVIYILSFGRDIMCEGKHSLCCSREVNEFFNLFL